MLEIVWTWKDVQRRNDWDGEESVKVIVQEGLNDEEEDFFDGYLEQRVQNGPIGITPSLISDDVTIPGKCVDDG